MFCEFHFLFAVTYFCGKNKINSIFISDLFFLFWFKNTIQCHFPILHYFHSHNPSHYWWTLFALSYMSQLGECLLSCLVLNKQSPNFCCFSLSNIVHYLRTARWYCICYCEKDMVLSYQICELWCVKLVDHHGPWIG